jgi:hypothetical protein
MSAALAPAAEAARLRKTISLAAEAIACACEYKQQAGALAADHLGASGALFATALAVESAAKACRKAARSALADLRVFPDLRTPEEIAAKIEAARSAALALKAACDDAQRFHASVQIRLAALDLKRAISECAAERATGGRAE